MQKLISVIVLFTTLCYGSPSFADPHTKWLPLVNNITNKLVLSGSIIASKQTICTEDSTILYLTTDNAVTRFEWYQNNVLLSEQNPMLVVKEAGTYFVKLYSSSGITVNTNSIVISQGIPTVVPVITAGGNTTFCDGGSVLLNSNLSNNLVWQKDGINILGASAQNYSATVGGKYRVKYQSPDGQCASFSNEIQVTVPNASKITITKSAHNTTLCLEKDTITLTANQSGIFWLKDGVNIGFSNSALWKVVENGTYKAYIPNVNGSVCSTFSNEMVITAFLPKQVPANITASGVTTICQGNNVVLTSDKVGIQWLKNGNAISGNTNIATYTVTESGAYSAILLNANTCNNNILSNVVSVTVHPLITPIISNGTIKNPLCIGTDSIVLTSNLSSVRWMANGITTLATNTNTLVVTNNATYTATTINNATGCNGTSNSIVVNGFQTPYAAPTITANGVTRFCSGNQLSLTSSNDNIYWQKDGVTLPATGNAYSVTTSGVYSVILKNTNQCTPQSTSNSITVIVDTVIQPTIQASRSTTLCLGEQVTLTADKLPIQWQKNGVNIQGANAATLVVSDSGSYKAVLTNSNGCVGVSNTIVVSVSNNQPPIIFTVGKTKFCQGSSTILSTTSSNVQWQRNGTDIAGQVYSSLIVNTSGVYTARLNITGVCGQVASNAISIAVYPLPDTPVISTTSPTLFCNGGSALLQSSIGNVQWQKDGVSIALSNTRTYQATQTGAYQALHFATDSACFSTSNTIVVTSVTPQPIPSISSSGSLSICEGTSVLLQASTSNVQWQLNGISIPGANQSSFLASKAGTYSVFIPEMEVCGNSQSNRLTVVVKPLPAAPIITASGNTSICEGSSVLLKSTVPVLWYKNMQPIVGTVSDTLRITQSGNYTAGYTSDGCTVVSNTINVEVNTIILPTISTTSALNICSGNSIIINSNIANVQWQKDNLDIADATGSALIVQTAGNYRALVRNGGCIGYSNVLTTTLTTTPNPPIITALGNTALCQGASVLLSSNVGGIQWMKDGANMVNQTSATLNVTNTGIYAAFISLNGCTSVSNSINVSVNALVNPIIAASGSTNVCTGKTLLLTSNLGNVQWQKDNINIDGATAQSVLIGTGGTYTALFTNGACIGKSNSLVVTMVPLPTAPTVTANGATTFCEGGSVVLTSNATSVQWFKNDQLITGASNPYINVATAGRYKAVATNQFGCTTNSNEITVSVLPVQTIQIGSSSGTLLCQGSIATLTSSVAGVVWQKNNQTIVGNGTATTYLATESGNYRAALLNTTCPAYSNTIALQVLPIPTAPIVSSTGATNICEGSSVILVSNTSGVQWMRNDTLLVGEINQTINATKTGNYKAIVTNTEGCKSVSNLLTVTVNVPQSISIAAEGATAVCSGKTVSLVANVSGVVWQKEGITLPNSSLQRFFASETGNYRAAMLNVLCPSYSNVISVQMLSLPVAPIITANGPTAICDSSSITLNSNIPNIQWYKDTSILVGATAQSLTVNKAGVYTALISNGTCSAWSNNITISQFKPSVVPIITAAGATTFCDGKSVNINSNVANITWLKDTTVVATNRASISATQAGNYRAVWTNERCPSYSNSINVTLLPNPVTPLVTNNDSILLCNGDSVKLTSNTKDVLWFKNGIYTQKKDTINFTTSQSGLYNAVAFATNGCFAFSKNVVVTAKSTPVKPVITSNATERFCSDTGALLTSNIQEIIWQRNGTYITNTNYMQKYLARESGTYRTVYFDTNGCVLFSNSYSLTALPSPYKPIIARVKAPALCDTGAIQLFSSVNAGTLQWQRDSINIANANSQYLWADSSGKYRLVISQTGSCTSTSNTLDMNIQNVLLPVILWDGNQLSTYNNYTDYQWYVNNIPISGAKTFFYKPTVVGKYRVDVLTKVTCTLQSDNFNILVTSTNPLPSNNNKPIRVYPNPVSNWLQVQLPTFPLQSVQIQIVAPNGQPIYATAFRSKEYRINVGNWSNGLYTVIINNGNNTFKQKILVVH